MNFFVRLTDTGCLCWRVWEVRAVILLLAGYPTRDILYGAQHALLCRGKKRAARSLSMEWSGNRVLQNWRQAIRDAAAGPNEEALIQKAIVHRDAQIVREKRAEWSRSDRSAPGLILPEMDRGASGSAFAVRDKQVRFAM